MDDSSLIEKKITSKCVYSSDFMKINRDQVSLPDGGIGCREYFVHPNAVVIIPRFSPTEYLLIRQFRYPVQQVMLEFPAGKLNIEEKPLVCAKRELLEETGYTAKKWTDLGVIHLCIGYSSEQLFVFLAEELTKGIAMPDEGEFVEPIEMTDKEINTAICTQNLTDGKSLSCWTRILLLVQ